MSGQHARLSASAAHRWMVCAGSVGPGSDTTFVAAEGTFAHDIASRCLKDSSLSPTDFFLKRAVIDGHTVECDQEMVDGVKVYLDAVDEDMLPGDIMWAEMPLLEELQRIDKDLGGTADYVRYRRSTQEALAADFKYGAGIYVDVVGNIQLRVYALGVLLALQRQKLKVKQIRIMVCQPRHWKDNNPVREEVFKAVELLDFMADIEEAAERTRQPNPPLVSGDHCQFCPKAATCPELTKKTDIVMAVDVAQPPITAEIAKALAAVPGVKQQIKALDALAYKLALQGVEIPGQKLVNKEPRRYWKRDGDVIEWAQGQGIDPYAPRDLMSPAQMDEKLKAAAPKGKKKEAVKVIEHLWEKRSSGTVLVPISDERPAVKAQVTAADFKTVASPSALSLF
jgi:hypothetical protein